MVNRRRILGRLVGGLLGSMGAALATVLGGAVASPGLARRPTRWIDAAAIGDTSTARPIEVALAVVRTDGYRIVRDRRVVYLVRDGDRVRALSATCTHLGCRVSWRQAEGEFRCPCHGGRFDGRGAVLGGPPPRRLDELPARVEDDRVFVEA